MSIKEYNHSLPNKINQIIKEKGYKKSAIAEKANIKTNDFYLMLNNRKIIKVIDVTNIANALDVPPSELFKTD